jgi:hypothetical protein
MDPGVALLQPEKVIGFQHAALHVHLGLHVGRSLLAVDEGQFPHHRADREARHPGSRARFSQPHAYEPLGEKKKVLGVLAAADD